MDEARTIARQNLIERISVQVIADSELRVQDENDFYSSSMQTRTQTLSRMQLRGSDYIAEKRADDSWRVTAFISKENFDRSMQMEAEQMLSSSTSAEQLK